MKSIRNSLIVIVVIIVVIVIIRKPPVCLSCPAMFENLGLLVIAGFAGFALYKSIQLLNQK